MLVYFRKQYCTEVVEKVLSGRGDAVSCFDEVCLEVKGYTFCSAFPYDFNYLCEEVVIYFCNLYRSA